MIEAKELLGLVEPWLPGQRWFGGKGRDATIALERLADLPGTEPTATIWLVRVSYTDGGAETYQLPLVAYAQPSATLEHALLGTVDSADGDRMWVYDALHDKAITGAWLSGVQSSYADDDLRFTLAVDAAEIPVGETSLVMTGEQSNTSLVYGGAALLKVFRRLHAGTNPDIEVHAALGHQGAKHIARLLGSVEATFDGEAHSLAMLQEFMTTATDGWDLAKASVRDLMAEADLHAAEAGGDFAAEAERLGVAVAEVHAELAAAFGTETITGDRVRAGAEAMRQRLEHAAATVAELRPLAPALSSLYEQMVSDAAASGSSVQRIHGDLHLAQALRTMLRWVVIDFEGEPLVDIAARREPKSPLRDVAGMLRSFDYVAKQFLVDAPHDQQLAYRAEEWTQRNRDAFCAGYAQESGADPRAHLSILRALEADKAVYEAVYESRNRPTWLSIPVSSLTRIAEGAA